MTRTTNHVVRSLLLFLGSCGVLFAGAHKDYEGCVRGCEQRLEAVSPHCLDDQIYYETGTLPELSECSHRFVEPISSVLPTELNLSPTEDPRVVRVRRFFQKHDCPVAKYSALFVRVADENKLDWRLLPTLAFLESTGGKNYKHNNIFGWNSGKTRFTSIPDGICLVARALSQYNVYAHKTTVQKIRVYNMHSRYLHRALEVMGEI